MSRMADDIDWSLTTWEGSRRETLRRWRRLSLREKLQALDEMNELADHFRQRREQRGLPTCGPDGSKQQR